ncbi:hypothetical protein Golomagni_00907 [Golovinomyces magnicellulatus]|nr:hypothetical protein Golomagni_00907 [Golovinomyces magnicellulatus]
MRQMRHDKDVLKNFHHNFENYPHPAQNTKPPAISSELVPPSQQENPQVDQSAHLVLRGLSQRQNLADYYKEFDYQKQGTAPLRSRVQYPRIQDQDRTNFFRPLEAQTHHHRSDQPKNFEQRSSNQTQKQYFHPTISEHLQNPQPQDPPTHANFPLSMTQEQGGIGSRATEEAMIFSTTNYDYFTKIVEF